MTHRERMLAAVRGRPTDNLPWAPRMDLWYIAQSERGTLPDGLSGANTVEIAEWLGAGCHAVRGDATLPRDRGASALRGLGFDNHPDYPYRLELPDLAMSFQADGEAAVTRISVSGGTVVFRLKQTPGMRRDGISLPFVLEYPVKTVADLPLVAEVFENLRVVPAPEAYDRFRRRVGDRGIAVASGSIAASPMHLLLHELLPMDTFFYLYVDHRSELEAFCARIEPFFDSLLEAVLLAEPDALLWGGNFDADLTWPPFYREQILPWLRKVGERCRKTGTVPVCHTDGENRGLTSLYRGSGFTVAESFCPSPMTSYTLERFREELGPEITVWGGVPSVALVRSSFPDTEFDRYVGELFESIAAVGTGGLILGVSDNVPPDADLDRLRRIGDLCAGMTG